MPPQVGLILALGQKTASALPFSVPPSKTRLVRVAWRCVPVVVPTWVTVTVPPVDALAMAVSQLVGIAKAPFQ